MTADHVQDIACSVNTTWMKHNQANACLHEGTNGSQQQNAQEIVLTASYNRVTFPLFWTLALVRAPSLNLFEYPSRKLTSSLCAFLYTSAPYDWYASMLCAKDAFKASPAEAQAVSCRGAHV